MTKSFCYIGIAILALAIVVGVLQDILYLLVGGAVFTLESFTNWFWLASAISLAASLILLKYYNYRKYTFTFLIAILSTLATLCQQGLFYLIISGRGELHRYYTFVVSFVLATAIMYALSFIF